MVRTGLSLFCLGITVAWSAYGAVLKPTWETTEGLSAPESALVDGEVLYVSNVAGGALDKDSKGWIGKYGLDGKVIAAQWVTGLNAPKGMGISGESLWVTDIDEVVEIVKTTGKISQRLAVPGAKFLNDIAVGSDGRVFVSDMLTSKIHFIFDGKVSLLVDQRGLAHPNGLYADEKGLTIATWGVGMAQDFSTKKPGRVFRYDFASKQIEPLTRPFGHLDGLMQTAKGDWVVSDWMVGKVYRVSTKQRKPEVIVDGLKSAADLGLAPQQGALFVPDMNASKLYRYQIN